MNFFSDKKPQRLKNFAILEKSSLFSNSRLKIIYSLLMLFTLSCENPKDSEKGNVPIEDSKDENLINTELQSIQQPNDLKIIKPRLLKNPNNHPDSLAKQEARHDEYQRILQKGTPYDSLSESQRVLFDAEPPQEPNPSYTGPIGCSWYCAAYPKTISATSSLDGSDIINYQPENLHDFDLQTAWVEGMDEHGVGEEITIEFELPPNLKLTHVEIYNGYLKSEETWKNNSRVKMLSFYANDDFVGFMELADSQLMQRFDIGEVGSDDSGNLLLTFHILEVYEGDKYMDTAISEINFDGLGDH